MNERERVIVVERHVSYCF